MQCFLFSCPASLLRPWLGQVSALFQIFLPKFSASLLDNMRFLAKFLFFFYISCPISDPSQQLAPLVLGKKFHFSFFVVQIGKRILF